MTQFSLFWTTSGGGDGTIAGYSPEQIWELFRALFGGDGVALGYSGELAVAPGIDAVTVAAGAALVSGVPYLNDNELVIAVPASAAQNRIDRIALRANWSAQTVRAVRIAGVEGSGIPPALTQQRGGIYEIELARVSVGIARVIAADTTLTSVVHVASIEVISGYALELAADATLNIEDIEGVLDARGYLQRVANAGVVAAKIADLAVTTPKLADNAATNAKLADMAAGTVKGRASGGGTGDPTDLSASQLIAVVATTTPDRLVNFDTTLVADLLVEWLEVAIGYMLEIADGVTLMLDDGGWSGVDADLLDGAEAYASTMHGHDYSSILHNHTGYASASHSHGYAAFSHSHAGYSAGAHGHSYAAASHSHGTSDLADNSIANAKLADMVETAVKGRALNMGSGDPGDLTAEQVIQILKTLNGVADGIDADVLDGVSSAGFSLTVHSHSGYSSLSHSHAGYSAAEHTHGSVQVQTVDVATDVLSGTIRAALWGDVVMLSGDLLLDAGGNPVTTVLVLWGYDAPVPVSDAICFGVDNAGASFRFLVESSQAAIESTGGVMDGRRFRFSMVYLAA